MYYFEGRDEAIAQFRREYRVGTQAKNADISGYYEPASANGLLYNSAGGGCVTREAPPRAEELSRRFDVLF